MRAIDRLPLTADAYQSAIELLEAQFGQKHKVINAYMEALIDIDTPTDSLPSLRLFRDMEYMPGDIHT